MGFNRAGVTRWSAQKQGGDQPIRMRRLPRTTIGSPGPHSSRHRGGGLHESDIGSGRRDRDGSCRRWLCDRAWRARALAYWVGEARYDGRSLRTRRARLRPGGEPRGRHGARAPGATTTCRRCAHHGTWANGKPAPGRARARVLGLYEEQRLYGDPKVVSRVPATQDRTALETPNAQEKHS